MAEKLPAVKAGDEVLEIVRDADGGVVHRSIVTGWLQRQIDRLERGMSINLDHANYTVLQRTATEDEPAQAAS